jgi:hypothetical protein
MVGGLSGRVEKWLKYSLQVYALKSYLTVKNALI